MYTRMIVGEVINAESIKQFRWAYNEHLQAVRAAKGFIEANLLIEEDGQMVVVTTDFSSREECLLYHSSRVYRQFVQATQHLLFGNFVVKLFNHAHHAHVSGGGYQDAI